MTMDGSEMDGSVINGDERCDGDGRRDGNATAVVVVTTCDQEMQCSNQFAQTKGGVEDGRMRQMHNKR